MEDNQNEKKYDHSIPLHLLDRYDREVERIKKSGYDLSKIRLTSGTRSDGKRG